MKKSILTAFLSVLALGACAESVTPEMAKAAANAWVLRNEHFGAGREAVTVRTVCDTNKAQTVLWHQVSMTGGGCVFVAPVTEIEPIMVALDSDPGELPKKPEVTEEETSVADELQESGDSVQDAIDWINAMLNRSDDESSGR